MEERLCDGLHTHFIKAKLKSFLSIIILLGASSLAAQDPISLPKITTQIDLDGVVTDAEWSGVDPLPMTMSNPIFRGEMTERTEIRVAYDKDFLYASGRMFLAKPNKVRTFSLSRDKTTDSDEFFAIVLDTFNDNENALLFETTPTGNRIDMTIFRDADFDGTEPMNPTWNTYWDVETTITDEGWFAEMRIPFSSLRFQSNEDGAVIGLKVFRWIGLKAEGHTYPESPPDWFLSIMKPSIAQDVIIEGVQAQKPIYVTPYAIGGYGFDNIETDDIYEREFDATRDVGLDVKYSLTSNLTADLTINTDFAQVEADDAQVNLTRFSLFFPEKRLFFQERASIFNFNMGGRSTLFYSRQIGLNEDGDRIPILGGARVVGRIGGLDVGVLSMQTRGSDFGVSENFAVGRLRKRIVNQYSYIGAMVTNRVDVDGIYNAGVGVDADIRVFGDDYFSFQVANTFDSEQIGVSAGDGLAANIGWARRNSTGLSYDTRAKVIGNSYDPGLGFQPRDDFYLYSGELGYGWRGSDESFLFGHSLQGETEIFWSNSEGEFESLQAGPSYFMNFKSGMFFFGQLRYNKERLTESFELSDDAEVLEGEYDFVNFSLFGNSQPGVISLRGRGNVGQYYDGSIFSLTLSPVWTASKFLEVSADLNFNRVRFPDRDQSFDGNVGRLRLAGALNSQISASTFIQYNSSTEETDFNFRLRYNPAEGNDLYLVFNQGGYQILDDLQRPTVRNKPDYRTLLVKYSHTFVL